MDIKTHNYRDGMERRGRGRVDLCFNRCKWHVGNANNSMGGNSCSAAVVQLENLAAVKVELLAALAWIAEAEAVA